jgi:hypothetical protein
MMMNCMGIRISKEECVTYVKMLWHLLTEDNHEGHVGVVCSTTRG